MHYVQRTQGILTVRQLTQRLLNLKTYTSIRNFDRSAKRFSLQILVLYNEGPMLSVLKFYFPLSSSRDQHATRQTGEELYSVRRTISTISGCKSRNVRGLLTLSRRVQWDGKGGRGFPRHRWKKELGSEAEKRQTNSDAEAETSKVAK